MSAEPHILVIDDEPQILRALRTILTANRYRVTVTSRGEEGLAYAAAEKPDLIILDLGLPDMDGITVCASLREWTQVPIIVLSVRDAEREKVLALDKGADDYLVKPFAFAELLARIRALIRRGRAADMLHLGIADLDMDLVTRKVSRAASTIELTAREFELLEHMLRHQGQVIMRDTMAREVWKEGARGTPLNNVIDVHIARLRRKIDQDHSIKLIHTVRGIGFMLREGEP